MDKLNKAQFCDLAERNEDLKRAKKEIQQTKEESQPWRAKQDQFAVDEMRYDRVMKVRG